MRRRDLLAAFGVAVAWPCLGRSQEQARTPLVGILLGGAATVDKDREQAFVSELAKLGWREGATIRIERRAFGGQIGRADDLAAELASQNPDVIWAVSSPALIAAKHATSEIPIVFMNVDDPVANGLAGDLSRPGGNATGFATSEPTIGGKRLQILREIAPKVRRVGLLYSVQSTNEGDRENIIAAGAKLQFPVITFPLRRESEIEAAVVAIAREPNSGLLVAPNSITGIYRKRIIALAALHRLPAIYPYEFHARSGGLVSYGVDLIGQAKGCAGYVDKILRGEKAGDLPIQLPTKFSLVINLTAAKALGLVVPPTLLAVADEVIE